MFLMWDVNHPLTNDEQNIELESLIIESEVQNAAIYQSLSFPKSILFQWWESYYAEHPEQL